MMKAPKKQWVVVGTAAVLGLSGAVTTAALALNDAPAAEQAGAAITLTGGPADDVTSAPDVAATGGAGTDGAGTDGDVVDDSPESADSPNESAVESADSPTDSPDDSTDADVSAESADSPNDSPADSPNDTDSVDSADSPADADSAASAD